MRAARECRNPDYLPQAPHPRHPAPPSSCRLEHNFQREVNLKPEVAPHSRLYVFAESNLAICRKHPLPALLPAFAGIFAPSLLHASRVAAISAGKFRLSSA
eukprot:3192036-Pleurochrysis_carterae.AAC.1